MKQYIKFKIILFVVAFLFFTPTVFAAKTFFSVKNSEIQLGNKFIVDFFLNTENTNINAFEGKIIFPKFLLSLKEIKDGNSIINFWIDRPQAENGEILFSGITPGGYLGKRGLIFSVIFQAKQDGQGLLKIQDIKALLNDGKGTAVAITVSNLKFVISQHVLVQPLIAEKKDISPPEIFEPIISSDSTMFVGKYFLVFTTQDKESGIDHYEVQEGNGKFIIATNPYLLQNQKLTEKIVVKAIDKSGNVRAIVLPPQKPLEWYQSYWIFVILIIVIGFIIVGVFLKKFYDKNKQNKIKQN